MWWCKRTKSPEAVTPRHPRKHAPCSAVPSDQPRPNPSKGARPGLLLPGARRVEYLVHTSRLRWILFWGLVWKGGG